MYVRTHRAKNGSVCLTLVSTWILACQIWFSGLWFGSCDCTQVVELISVYLDLLDMYNQIGQDGSTRPCPLECRTLLWLFIPSVLWL